MFYIILTTYTFINRAAPLCGVIELLKKNGLRLTPQRLELVRILEKMGRKHPSFSEICDAMRRRHANVSRSTVLRNLNEMVEMGLISSFSYGGETRYELSSNPHVNLVNPDGAILDIEDEDIRQLMLKLMELVNRHAGVNAKHIVIMAE